MMSGADEKIPPDGGGDGLPVASAAGPERHDIHRICPAGCVYVDRDGVILKHNSGLSGLLGCPGKDITGHSLAEYCATADKALLRDFIGSNFHGVPFSNCDAEFVRASGDYFAARLNVSLPGPGAPDRGPGKSLPLTMMETSDLKNLSDALRRAETRYKNLFKNFPDPALTISLDNGEITDLNSSCEKLVRRRRSELEGKHYLTLFPPGAPGVPSSPRDLIPGAGDVPATTEVVGKDGRRVAVSLRSSVIESEGRKSLLVTLRDISQRKKTEANYLESEKRFTALFETMPSAVVIFETDGAGGSADFKIQRVNRAFLEIFGLRGDVPLPPPAVIFQDMAGAVLSNLRDAVSGKKAVNFELECKKTDRILSAAAHSFEKGVAACVLTDITDIKKAEREKAKLTAAIEQTGEAVIITGRDGSVEYVNPSFERSSGLSRERVTGRSISMFKSGGSGADFMESALLPAARDGVWRGRVTGRRSDGVRLEEDLTVSPIRDSSGSRISNYVIVSRDVTEQVKFERHLRQTQKLNAIGSLAGGIAHDFNNILTAIMGYTQMSMELSPPDSDVRKYLETILKAGGRAKSLIKQILTFSRKTGGKAVFVKPSAIIAEVTELVKSTAPANIQISLSSSSDAEILADPTELHQVFMNLCSNAIHAMRGKGGTLGVSVESVRLEEGDMPVEMREMPAGVYVRMSFRDTGCGMPSEVLERIFEPFFSTKDQSESTGMGLSVVHGIVKGMGGKIAVKSEVGAGSLFQIYVPGAGSVPDVERIVSKAAALSASVLIAGRTDDFVRAAAALCSEAGHRPVAPPSGVRDPGDIPKNLLGECDVVLAENFDGISAAVEKIHAGRTDLPVIIPLPAGAEKPVPGKEGLVFHTDWPAGVAELRAAVRRALESAILDA